MRTITAVLLIGGALFAQDAEKLYLEGPKDAKAEDLEKAAKAIGKRIAEYGYKGVRAKVLEKDGKKIVEISCETGFTDKMIERIGWLSGIPATSVEFRTHPNLTDAEREQYKPGPTRDKDKCPKGTKWYQRVNINFSLGSNKEDNWFYLLCDNPVISRNNMSKAVWKVVHKENPDYKEWGYELTKDASQKLKGVRSLALLVDGKAVEEFQNMSLVDVGGPMLFLSFSDAVRDTEAKAIETVLTNPLPFALKVVK